MIWFQCNEDELYFSPIFIHKHLPTLLYVVKVAFWMYSEGMYAHSKEVKWRTENDVTHFHSVTSKFITPVTFILR